MDPWIVVLIGIQVAFVAFIIWLSWSHQEKQKSRQSQEKLQILENFESSQDFSDFLASDHGREFLSTFQPTPPNPKSAWTTSLFMGLPACFVGSGFLLLSWLGAETNKGEDFLVPAILLIAAGGAVLLAGYVTRQSNRS